MLLAQAVLAVMAGGTQIPKALTWISFALSSIKQLELWISHLQKSPGKDPAS